MNISKGQAEKIRRFCIDFYKTLDFAHHIEHMNRTVRIAEYIARKENVNLQIARLGAMVHQFHDNMDKLRAFLDKINLDSQIAERLLECAKFRPLKKKTGKRASIEAMVVFDADALQVIGPHGIVREIACNIGARNKAFDRSIEDARETESLFYKSLQTKTARKLAKKPYELTRKFWKEYYKAKLP
ncbi:MAG: hypothetical protein HYW25_05795 [Candidatus Aenigmarchaeota archaeon]|nr:hypothetical protein [Candidatus Aenigmarchaeota archaeon]